MRNRGAALLSSPRSASKPVRSAATLAAACLRNSSPAGVSRMPRPSRAKSGMPAACSSSRIVRVTAGWLRLSASAAFPTAPSRATSRKVESWRYRMLILN